MIDSMDELRQQLQRPGRMGRMSCFPVRPNNTAHTSEATPKPKTVVFVPAERIRSSFSVGLFS